MEKLDELLGPSKYLAVLDLFLQNPEELMNLREIARRIKKNPGSIIHILPILVDRKYISLTRVGSKVVAYKLNRDNHIVNLLQQLLLKIKKEAKILYEN